MTTFYNPATSSHTTVAAHTAELLSTPITPPPPVYQRALEHFRVRGEENPQWDTLMEDFNILKTEWPNSIRWDDLFYALPNHNYIAAVYKGYEYDAFRFLMSRGGTVSPYLIRRLVKRGVDIRNFLASLGDWKEYVARTMAAAVDISETIKDSIATEAHQAMMPDVSFKDFRLEQLQNGVDDGECPFELHFNFEYPQATIKTAKGKYWLAPSVLSVVYCMPYDETEFSFLRIMGHSHGSYTNPHINGARGGNACLGTAEINVAQSAEDDDWFQLLFTLKTYNESANIQDMWGQRIKQLDKVLKNKANNTDTINYHGEYMQENCNIPDQDIVGYKARNGIYPHEDFIKCAVTGKYIRRNNAIRLPIFVSEEGLRLKWKRNQFPERYAIDYTNTCDVMRMERELERIKAARNKRHMVKYHTEALRLVESEEKYLARRADIEAERSRSRLAGAR